MWYIFFLHNKAFFPVVVLVVVQAVMLVLVTVVVQVPVVVPLPQGQEAGLTTVAKWLLWRQEDAEQGERSLGIGATVVCINQSTLPRNELWSLCQCICRYIASDCHIDCSHVLLDGNSTLGLFITFHSSKNNRCKCFLLPNTCFDTILRFIVRPIELQSNRRFVDRQFSADRPTRGFLWGVGCIVLQSRLCWWRNDTPWTIQYFDDVLKSGFESECQKKGDTIEQLMNYQLRRIAMCVHIEQPPWVKIYKINTISGSVRCW